MYTGMNNISILYTKFF